MQIYVSDRNAVPETGDEAGMAVLFDLVHQEPVKAYLTIENQGVNPISYILQEYNGTLWVDIDEQGTIFNDILPASGEDCNRGILLDSDYPAVRMLGSASGASILGFSLTRRVDRVSGGTLPILSV